MDKIVTLTDARLASLTYLLDNIVSVRNSLDKIQSLSFSGNVRYTSTPQSLSVYIIPPGEPITIIPKGLFPVTVSSDGGYNGTNTTAASWTYAVISLSFVELGTGKSPTWARQIGQCSAATKGVAYYDADGALVLYQVDEVMTTAGCA